METRIFKIKVQEKTTQDGRKFLSYKTFTKNDRAITVKFTKDVKDVPKTSCSIECLEGNAQLNDSGEYPVLWVSQIERIISLDEGRAEANAKKLADYFG